MSNEFDTDFAFPVSTECIHNGMELRDYFAAKAIPQAFKVASAFRVQALERNHLCDPGGPDDFEWEDDDYEMLGLVAYEIADAMMEARGQKAADEAKEARFRAAQEARGKV